MKLPLNEEQKILLKKIETEGYVIVKCVLDSASCQNYKNQLNKIYNNLHQHYALAKKKSEYGLNGLIAKIKYRFLQETFSGC